MTDDPEHDGSPPSSRRARPTLVERVVASFAGAPDPRTAGAGARR